MTIGPDLDTQLVSRGEQEGRNRSFALAIGRNRGCARSLFSVLCGCFGRGHCRCVARCGLAHFRLHPSVLRAWRCSLATCKTPFPPGRGDGVFVQPVSVIAAESVADLRERPWRALAAPRGSGPATGRLPSHFSISASVQARLLGPIILPRGNASRSMRRLSIGQLLMMPRACRSRNRSSRIIGVLRLINRAPNYAGFSAPSYIIGWGFIYDTA